VVLESIASYIGIYVWSAARCTRPVLLTTTSVGYTRVRGYTGHPSLRLCIRVNLGQPFTPAPTRMHTLLSDDDKFTPTKHLTPPPHHSSRPAAAHTDTETPLLHQKKGRARRRTAPTGLAQRPIVGPPKLAPEGKRTLPFSIHR